VLALNVLTSRSWMACPKFPSGSLELPFIDRWGKFTGANIYTSNLDPLQYISVVVSTISRRLKFWALSHNGERAIGEYNKRQQILLRAAAIYAFTNNDYFMNRILVLSKDLRSNYKAISSIVHKFATRVDDYTWFVYGHVCLQTQWLTSRAVRPRDKSIMKKSFLVRTGRITTDSDWKKYSYEAVWHTFKKMSQMSSVVSFQS